jgi:hypothetical protein
VALLLIPLAMLLLWKDKLEETRRERAAPESGEEAR